MSADLHPDELYGDGILYHERVLPGRKGDETRYTLTGALLATLAGTAASVVLAGWMG